MKQQKNLKMPTIAVLIASAVLPLSAATIQAGPASGGIAYNWGITLGAADSGSVAGGVGQWSWEDPNVPGGGPGGWGHTSHWIALTLTSSSILELNLARNANVPDTGSVDPGDFLAMGNYFPSFTIWQNHDTDAAPATFAASPNLTGNWHTYANTANVEWAEDLVYLDHHRNTGSQTSVTEAWSLPAGNYTLVVGGLAPSSADNSRQGYLATFTASPIPEPGSLAFLALTGLATLRRRRR